MRSKYPVSIVVLAFIGRPMHSQVYKRTSLHEEYAFELSKLQFVSITDISPRAAVLCYRLLRLRKLEGCRAIITDGEIEKVFHMRCL